MDLFNNPIVAFIIAVIGSGVVVKLIDIIGKIPITFMEVRKHIRSYHLMVIADLKKDLQEAKQAVKILEEEQKEEKKRITELSWRLYSLTLIVKKLISYLRINKYIEKSKELQGLVEETEDKLEK